MTSSFPRKAQQILGRAKKTVWFEKAETLINKLNFFLIISMINKENYVTSAGGMHCQSLLKEDTKGDRSWQKDLLF